MKENEGPTLAGCWFCRELWDLYTCVYLKLNISGVSYKNQLMSCHLEKLCFQLFIKMDFEILSIWSLIQRHVLRMGSGQLLQGDV